MKKSISLNDLLRLKFKSMHSKTFLKTCFNTMVRKINESDLLTSDQRETLESLIESEELRVSLRKYFITIDDNYVVVCDDYRGRSRFDFVRLRDDEYGDLWIGQVRMIIYCMDCSFLLIKSLCYYDRIENSNGRVTCRGTGKHPLFPDPCLKWWKDPLSQDGFHWDIVFRHEVLERVHVIKTRNDDNFFFLNSKPLL